MKELHKINTEIESPVYIEEPSVKTEAKTVNLFPDENSMVGVKKLPLGMDEEISGPLARKINEYEKKLGKLGKLDIVEKRKLNNTLKKLKSIQELAIYEDESNPIINNSPKRAERMLLRKIEGISDIEDLKEIYETFKNKLSTGMPESDKTDVGEMKIMKVKQEIVGIIEKEKSEMKDTSKEIVHNLYEKIKEYEEKIEKARWIDFLKKKKLENTLNTLSSVYQSIHFKKCVEPETVYKLLEVDDLIDIGVSIMNETSIRKLKSNESVLNIEYVNEKFIDENLAIKQRTEQENIAHQEVKKDSEQVSSEEGNEKEKDGEEVEINAKQKTLILEKVEVERNKIQNLIDKTSWIKFKRVGTLKNILEKLELLRDKVNADINLEPSYVNLGMFNLPDSIDTEGLQSLNKLLIENNDLLSEKGEKQEAEASIETQMSPEEIKSLEQIVFEKEAELKAKLESSKFEGKVINGLSKWEKYGQGEDGPRGFTKRMTKVGVNLALIGLISSFSVQELAENGVGTASSLAGGVFSKIAMKMGFGLAMGASMDTISRSGASEKVKKWIPKVVGGVFVGAAFLSPVGWTAGATAGGAFALGLFSQKFVKDKFTDEKIAEREEKAKIEFLNKIKLENKNIDEKTIKETEDEFTKIFNKYKRQRIWGKLLDGVAKLSIGTLISDIALEVSGEVHDHMNDNPSPVEVNHEDQTKIEEVKESVESKTSAVEPITKIETEDAFTKEELENSIVHKGEGIENTLIRQIENDSQKAIDLGYKGDLDDTKALHLFAGDKAHLIAEKTGYVDGDGNEVRVADAGKIGYVLNVENGHGTITEITSEGKIIEIHHEGDKFENTPDKGEYIKSGEVEPN